MPRTVVVHSQPDRAAVQVVDFLSGHDVRPGAVAVGGAASIAATPRLTVSGEILGRNVSELRDVTLASAPHPTIAGVDTLRLVAGDSAGTIMTALAGLKWNVTGTLVLGGHIAWPLTHSGLTAPFTPTFAFEYAF